MNTAFLLDKLSSLEKRCQQNELDIKDKENMIYSLNKKIERIFLSNENLFPSPDPKNDSSPYSKEKLGVIETINSMILEICIKKMEEKAELIEDKIYQNLEQLEKRIEKLEFPKQKNPRLQEQGNQGEKIGKFEFLQKKTSAKLTLFEARLSKLEESNNMIRKKDFEGRSQSLEERARKEGREEREGEKVLERQETKGYETARPRIHVEEDIEKKGRIKVPELNLGQNDVTWAKENILTDRASTSRNRISSFFSWIKPVNNNNNSNNKINMKTRNIRNPEELNDKSANLIENIRLICDDMYKVKAVIRAIEEKDYKFVEKMNRFKEDCETNIKDIWDEIVSLNNNIR